jgi:hypothetical protein
VHLLSERNVQGEELLRLLEQAIRRLEQVR